MATVCLFRSQSSAFVVLRSTEGQLPCVLTHCCACLTTLAGLNQKEKTEGWLFVLLQGRVLIISGAEKHREVEVLRVVVLRVWFFAFVFGFCFI